MISINRINAWNVSTCQLLMNRREFREFEFKAGTNLGAAQKAVGRISKGPSRAWKMVDVFISPVTQKVLHRNDSIRHHRIQNTSCCMKLGPNWSKPYCSVQPFPGVTLLPAKWMISGNKISERWCSCCDMHVIEKWHFRHCARIKVR